MIYLSIQEFIDNNPEKTRFKIFRVSDGYKFTVKEVLESTIILNTHVHLEVPIDTEEYKVHEYTFGLDYTLPKVFRYAPSELDKPVQALNFRKELTTRLHNKKTWVFGRLIKEEFFPFLDDLKTVDLEDKILSVTYDYDFHALTKEADYRLEQITWYNELGEVFFVKPQPKLYKGHEGMAEAKTRRSNIINYLKHDLDVMSKGGDGSGAALVEALILELSPYITAYVEYGQFSIISVIDASTNALLDSSVAVGLTARDFMKTRLDFLSAEQANPNLYKGSLL